MYRKIKIHQYSSKFSSNSSKKIAPKNWSKIGQKNWSNMKKIVKKNRQIVIHNKEPQETSRKPKSGVLRMMTPIYDTISVLRSSARPAGSRNGRRA